MSLSPPAGRFSDFSHRAASPAHRRQLLLLACVAAIGYLLACESSSGPGSLSITPESPSIRVGDSVQLTAIGSNGAVAWTTSDPNVATVQFGLVRGIGGGAATVTATVGSRSATTSVTVVRPATIVIDSAAVAFATTAGGPLPAAQTVAVTNGGDTGVGDLTVASIAYSTGASDWLSATLSAQTAPATLTLQPTTSALAQGTYTATVTITSSTAVNSPREINVTYTIGNVPVITFSPAQVSVTAQTNAAPPAVQAVTITNGGGGTLSGLAVDPSRITYSPGATGWLTASVAPDTAPATLSLQVTTTALAAATYTATVPVTSTVPGVSEARLTVTYVVSATPPPPTIALSATSVTFQAGASGPPPAAQVVHVSNSGSGTLSGLAATVSYGGGQPSGWLTSSFTSTTAPADLSLQPNTALPPGSYTATVTVTSPNASNTPQIAVSYNVPAIGLQATTASFTSTQSFSDPTPQTVGVFNAGGGTLSGLTASVSYGAGQPTSWLAANVPSTAPRPPGSALLTLTVTTGTIPPGTYTATVTVSSTTLPSVPSAAVTVTFTRVATLSGDIQQIFSGSCAACHYTALPTDGVDLSTAQQSYLSLVNAAVASPGVSATRVVPFDSLSSYLIKQLKGSATVSADNMPPGCSSNGTGCLDPTLVHRIAIWIQQGARQNP